MSCRRIAVVEPIAHLGGAEISLLELIRCLNGDPEVTVILPEDGPLHDRIIEAGGAVRVLNWPSGLLNVGERSGLRSSAGVARAAWASLRIPHLARELSRLLDELDPDVVITNGIKPHIIGALAQLRSSRPLIWYLRDGLEGRPVSKLMLKALAHRSAGAVAISNYVAREARSLLGDALPIRVIYNLVDFDKFRPDVEAAPDLYKEPAEIWFGIVGPLTPLKGQDLFLQAAALVADRLPRAKFVVVGSNFYRTEASGDFQTHLRSLANAPSLAGKVAFLGHRDDVPAVLRRLDVVVQANRGPEALGRSVLEAMACGSAVIVVDKWGPAEVVRDRETGLHVPVLDVPALAEKMLTLGTDDQLRRTLAAAAFTWVRGTLDPHAIVGAFRAFVDERSR